MKKNNQKSAETEREQLLQEKSALLDCTGEGIYGIDLHGKCMFINQSGATLLGYTKTEVLGKNVHTLLHSRYSDGSAYPEESCPLTKEIERPPLHLENEIIWRKNATSIPVDYIASPIIVEKKIVGTVISFTDITLRQEREQRKDEFFSIASHELKTPITTIKAFNQLLTKYYASDPTSQASLYLSKVDIQLTRLTKLVQDLLDVSRIQAGKLLYNKEIFDLNELTTESIEDFQFTTQHHTLVYKGNKGHYIQGDKYRIGQVLHNILHNAIKYSPSGGKVEVVLSSRKIDFLISVKDYGIGIPKDHLPNIFERFYRIEDTTRGNFPGLGIGLYLSSEIIKRHGGSIWAESVEGQGTTITFSLPKHSVL